MDECVKNKLYINGYTHNGILYTKKEWNSVIWENMDGIGENYAKWNRPGIEKILHFLFKYGIKSSIL